MGEKELQTDCEDILKKHNILFIHLPKLSNFKTKKYYLKGIPDLIIFKNSKVLFIELKMPKCKLSKDQILFRDRVMGMNYEYYIVYSLQEFINVAIP